jgi:uncharacterized protein YlzI (FlbEa/FlbD family)
MATDIAQEIRWLREHYQELQEKYPDMYVAIYEGKVIAADRDFGKVYEKARPYGDKVVIEYISSGDLVVL